MTWVVRSWEIQGISTGFDMLVGFVDRNIGYLKRIKRYPLIMTWPFQANA